MLRAARLQNALTFLGTPFQIDAWVAAHGLSFALSEMTSLLENITTPNISQNVFETAEWSGSKFVEYQFLSSSMVKVQSRQCPSSPLAPLQGTPDRSGQLGTPRKRPCHLTPSHCLGSSS